MTREEFDLALKDWSYTLRVDFKTDYEEWQDRSVFELYEAMEEMMWEDEGNTIRHYLLNTLLSFRKDYPWYTFQFNIHELGITLLFQNKKTGKPWHFLIEKNTRGTWRRFWNNKASDAIALIWRAFEQFN